MIYSKAIEVHFQKKCCVLQGCGGNAAAAAAAGAEGTRMSEIAVDLRQQVPPS